MKIFKLIYVLYKIKLLSPLSLYLLIESLFKCGINLMTLLDFAAKKYGDEIALVDDYETFTYKQLFDASNKLAFCLKDKVKLKEEEKVAFLCKNHASFIKAIFAVSRLGADIYLLNAEIGETQFNQLVNYHNFDLLIYDLELGHLVESSDYNKKKLLSYHDSLPAISNLICSKEEAKIVLPRISGSKIIMQTSGSTGIPKDVPHKPSLHNYLSPFIAFIKSLDALKYHTVYIATPIYHGYGIAILLLFMPLGKKIVISKGFNGAKACKMVKEHRVQIMTVVPQMLQKMLDENPKDLESLHCIVSGGARLSVKLAKKTFNELGSVLYNMYGTSEAGLNFIATPKDLLYNPSTIGKKIHGSTLKILDDNKNEVAKGVIGEFCIKNDWSMNDIKSPWIQTGDLGYRDENGYYFLCGRIDDRIISGGENVYPIEVEQVLMTHPLIDAAAVIGINDEVFGQRLKAFVVTVKDTVLTEEELIEWLRTRVARFQLPKEIQFLDYMPYNPLGIINKKELTKK